MVLVRFGKIEEGMFISEGNLNRILERILRISKIQLNSSFENSVSVCSGTRLGVESTCEYMTIETSLTPSQVEEAIKVNLPSWLYIIYAVGLEENINIKSFCSAAQYKVTFDEFIDFKDKVKEYFSNDNLVLEASVHGQVQTSKVMDKILSIDVLEEDMIILAKINEDSLRIDELVKQMLKSLSISKNHYSIVKQELYYKDLDGEYVCLEDYISQIKVR